MARGIDVYTRYQRVTNWHAVRSAGVEFCWIKVSDGTRKRRDKGYGAKAKAATIRVGGYHYAQPGDPIRQANLLCDRIEQLGATDLAPALDLEDPFTPGPTAAQFAVRFVRQVRARGHRPALYGNNSMLSVVRGPVVAAVPETVVWVARYGADPTVEHHVWQWSSTGRVPGVSASGVDMNKGAVPLNTRTVAEEPKPVNGDDDMYVACQGLNDDNPELITYGLYSGGVLTAYGNGGEVDALLKDVHDGKKILDWMLPYTFRELDRKSKALIGDEPRRVDGS